MSCLICQTPLTSKRAKICKNNKCVSSWKMIRNSKLPNWYKNCGQCGTAFETKDRRNNFCSSTCKAIKSNDTKLKKYGTLSLESKVSVQNRIKKIKKRLVLCIKDGCEAIARANRMCAKHFIEEMHAKASNSRVFFLFGCFGAGKTWVAHQLTDKYCVIEYDKYRKTYMELIEAAVSSGKPVLFVSSVKITSFMRKYGLKYGIVPVGLVESLETVQERIIKRGGQVTNTLERRVVRVKAVASKYAKFSGNSEEVLEFLRTVTL